MTFLPDVPGPVYRLRLDGFKDPVLETLAAPHLYTVYATEYLIAPAHGRAYIGYGRVPRLETVYPLVAAQINPATLVGVRLGVALPRDTYSPRVLAPFAGLVDLRCEPLVVRGDVEFTAVAATMARPTRRGLELVASIMETELLLYGLGLGDKATLEATTQAFLLRLAATGGGAEEAAEYSSSLWSPETGWPWRSYHTSGGLGERAASVLAEAIEEGDPWEAVVKTTMSDGLAGALLGRHYLRWSKYGRVPSDTPVNIARKTITLLEAAAQDIGGGSPVYIATGRFSFADLYLLSHLQSEETHLLVTGETLRNLTYLVTRLGATVEEDTLTVDVAGKPLRVRLYLVAHGDYNLVGRIISAIPDHIVINKKLYYIAAKE